MSPGPLLPVMILVLIIEWKVDFDLVLHAEALLVDEVGGEAGRAGGVGGGGDDEFVLRIGFFRDQSAGQIELSAGPVRIGAEGAQVGDDVVDVCGGKQVAEGRHDGGEAARWAAVDDDGFPRGVGLGCGLRALREIGKGAGAQELGGGLGSALAQIAVTGDAAGLVDLFAVRGAGRFGIAKRLRAGGQRGCTEGEADADEQRKRGGLGTAAGTHSGEASVS